MAFEKVVIKYDGRYEEAVLSEADSDLTILQIRPIAKYANRK